MDRTPPLFCTWSELRALDASGLVDVQAHSWRHAKVAVAGEADDFLRPNVRLHPHDVPLVDAPEGLRLATAADLGAPLHPLRSRLSDARRWIAPGAFAACVDLVCERGGAAFFDRPDWRSQLLSRLRGAPPGRFETDEERDASIEEDLRRARETLEAQLGRPVRHMCFPWAIAGESAVRLAARAGYRTAFSDRLGGARAVRAGDPPFRLMRLKHRLIACLPGNHRVGFFGRKPADAASGLRLDPVAP